MAAEENLLSTPAGYATPNQIAAMREYAKALMQPGQIRPLAHWMPAVADAVKGLTGGYQMYRAGEREKESADFTGAAQTHGLMGAAGMPGSPTRPSGGRGAASEGTPATPAPGPSASPSALGYAPQGASMGGPEIEAYIRQAAAARGIDPNVALQVYASEGKGGVGPSLQSTVVKNGVREPSFGPYQLYMGGGLGNEFQTQTGMDPRDPSTFRQQIDFALDNAARGGWGPWYGWKGDKWAGINRGGQQPLAFAGTPNVDPGLPSNALALTAPRGVGGQPASTRGGAGPVSPPLPTAGGIPGMMTPVPIPPGLLNRTAPSPEVMRHLLGAGAGYANPGVTNTLADLFLKRNQPQQLQTPFGTIMAPAGSNQGYFIPTPKDRKTKVDGIEVEESIVFDPTTQSFKVIPVGGGPGRNTGIPTPPSGSPDTPPPPGLLPGAAPAPARPAAAPPQQQATTPPPAQQQTAAPAAPASTPAPQAGAAPGTQADLELPSSGVTQNPVGGPINFAPEGAQSSLPPSMLNTLPPEILTGQSAPRPQEQGQEPTAFTAGQGGQQTAQATLTPEPAPAAAPAQAGPTSTLSPQTRSTIGELQDISLGQKGRVAHQEEDTKLYKETAKNLYSTGQAARTMKQQILLGQEHIQEGRAFQGRTAGIKQEGAGWLADIAPIFGFKELGQQMSNRAGSTQVFEKAISSQILNDLKVMLQGLGQIRVAEIDLMNKAAPSIYNQPQANKALLDLGMRAATIGQDLSTMAAWYDRGARVDQMGKLIVGPDGRPTLFAGRPTTEGLQRTLQAVYDNHPQKLTPEQLVLEQNKIFGPAKGPVQTFENRPQQTPAPRGGRGVPSQRTQAPPPPEGFE